MKALWLGRLSRPDIVKPINDLATKVQNWSRAEDKKLLRLIQYIAATPHYRLVGTVNDAPEELELQLYVDADFAGEKSDAHSHLWRILGSQRSWFILPASLDLQEADFDLEVYHRE